MTTPSSPSSGAGEGGMAPSGRSPSARICYAETGACINYSACERGARCIEAPLSSLNVWPRL